MQRKIFSFFEPKTGPSTESSSPEKHSATETTESPSDLIETSSEDACRLPLYPDIAKLSQDDLQNDSIKHQLLSKMWDKAAQFKFPFRTIRDKKRSLQWNWLEKNPWMRYSVSEDSVYCGPCVLFGPQRSDTKEKTFGFSSPVTDWANLSRCISRHLHEGSKHHENVLAADEFMRIVGGNKSDILASMSDSYNARVERNRNILSCIIDAIVICGKQNFALRGHEEQDSNFVALLHMRAKDNTVLADHLAFADPNKKYTSPDIQNELIELCADQIVKSIVHDCNSARYFGFIADEATDCSTKEQASICIRFYDQTIKTVREEFLGFVEAQSTTGEALAELFTNALE